MISAALILLLSKLLNILGRSVKFKESVMRFRTNLSGGLAFSSYRDWSYFSHNPQDAMVLTHYAYIRTTSVRKVSWERVAGG